ncbi:ABC transporter ATP-binding protein [Leucobacter chromiiresistens]|uniref:Peptide/nickel transport system ATP-binding protein n=1 Tax=Leucobacter chromiiresistens TaxID=1079994 RepID=A0A1H0YNU1_9MICO|nr:ABC transporter ATP-binding protein [Leucobacter chromiiresistens]SDQ16823.1 peptide/nickel transport system ATP-binding protein [Leucobacter chromiiresistens]
MTLLHVDHLTVARASGAGSPLVDGVSFTVEAGEVVGVVGESGSGKTLTGLALLGLLPDGLAASGSIRFDGRELLTQTKSEWERTRGTDIAMVLQDPSSSLHPMLKLGEQLTDHVRQHLGLSKPAAEARAIELMERVHLREPKRLLGQYPHQLSGGMKQRVSIAIALACDPKLLIADEPTTALDANIRTGIIALLNELRRESGMGIIFVTHDLAMLSTIADRLNVFRTGEIVEAGDSDRIFRSPQHPYTRVLLDAVPQVPWPLPEEVLS